MSCKKANSGSFKKGQTPWNKGLTKETDKRVLKNTEALKGLKRTKEQKLKMSLAQKEASHDYWKNKTFSEEHKEKLSLAKLGKPSPKKGTITSKETKLKQRQAVFKYAQKNRGAICPKIGKKEFQILNLMEDIYKLKIIRQFKVLGYFLDGYIPSLNLAFEVDEKYHSKQLEKDLIRENNIREYLNCKFLRIPETLIKKEELKN